jgi:serralysin
MAGPSGLTLFFDDGAPFLSGVNVAAVARSNDGHADIITGFGPGGSSLVQTFDGDTLQRIDSFFAFNTTIPGGVFVGAA